MHLKDNFIYHIITQSNVTSQMKVYFNTTVTYSTQLVMKIVSNSSVYLQGFFDKGGKSSKGDHHKSHKHGSFKKGAKGGKGHKKGSKGSFGKGHSKKVCMRPNTINFDISLV